MQKTLVTIADKEVITYSKTRVKRALSKRPQIGFHDQLLLNAGQEYCRMPQGEHSAILSTFIKLSFVIKIFVLYIFEWLFYTGFNVHAPCILCLVLVQPRKTHPNMTEKLLTET